ncbi:hypothetical protein LQK80_25575 [Bacillus thuringiensis]|nr:hypothetical protein [Bacillus thuringiensis]
MKSGMVNYKIQSIDPMDMTGIKKQYYIMLGKLVYHTLMEQAMKNL